MVNLKDIYTKENQRICFDLDNTLVTFPKVDGDYSTVEPIQKNIDAVRHLYDMGHHIIIYTARRMRTHNGDVEKAIEDIGEVTEVKIEEFGIPYHELIYGKPYAQYYIDDLALNPHVIDISDVLGLGAVQPRKFNNIVYENGKVIKSAIGSSAKKSLEGERYWYETIPEGLEDLFPNFLSSDNGTIEIEKITGPTFTHLMLEDVLTDKHLFILLESIERIHDIRDNDIYQGGPSIYHNYNQKVTDRFMDYDYSRFRDSTDVCRKIINKVKEYEASDLGIRAVIHGDPVFSNVLLTSDTTIKLIDMRGEIGGRLTKVGDVFYDYAKIYQSLVGYDLILVKNQAPRLVDQFPLKNVFEEIFVSKFGNDMLGYLKYLTASLFFSLIPLHDNEKCEKFYNCIFDLIGE